MIGFHLLTFQDKAKLEPSRNLSNQNIQAQKCFVKNDVFINKQQIFAVVDDSVICLN